MDIKRTSGLTTTKVGDEVLVYVSATAKCHTLNDTAGQVFLACENVSSLNELQQSLSLSDDDGLNEALILESLKQLADMGLVECSSEDAALDLESKLLARRDLLKVAGVALPAMLTLAMPSPAVAESFDPCTVGGQAGFCFPPVSQTSTACSIFGSVAGSEEFLVGAAGNCAVPGAGTSTFRSCSSPAGNFGPQHVCIALAP